MGGNYSICHDGEYAEVYFRKDSMRFAKDDEWVKLSEWRKTEIDKDTLHFESFGEWTDSVHMVIRYTSMNGIELRNIKSGEILNLEPIKDNLRFDQPKKFWNGYYDRQKSSHCGKAK